MIQSGHRRIEIPQHSSRLNSQPYGARHVSDRLTEGIQSTGEMSGRFSNLPKE